MAEDRVTVDITTGVGTISFPHLFRSTATTNDKGETMYDVQLIIPKSQRDDARALLAAIKKVGEAKWGAKWKQVRNPLRDGDAEKDELTEDGKTKGEKYPERLGCYFINARSSKPVAVVDRSRTPITDPDDVYGGCKGKISVTFYPYAKSGNTGIGAGLNGVQKIADGTPFGGGPAVESMFDALDDDDLLDDDEPVAKKKRPAARKKPGVKRKASKVSDEDI